MGDGKGKLRGRGWVDRGEGEGVCVGCVCMYGRGRNMIVWGEEKKVCVYVY